jgi:translocation and assembly module TamB
LPEDKIYPLSAEQIELVQAKLSQLRQDTSEMNKQVFAVLILGRFVSDDPFNSAAAQGVGFAAVQSVSTFIGEQLNKAANNLIKGVDLSVDLATTQDYTTGDMRQRTDLNVAASKRVLNDRLKLTVGNDFEVEGPQPNNSQSQFVPSNLAADYLLSADGRYTVRVYRGQYNEGALLGYVTETGVNFIVSVDYNQFKTVFMRSKNRKRQTKLASK